MTVEFVDIKAEQNTCELSGYFDKRLLVFRVQFENTKLNFGVEDLHKLRVEIKKQRAFLRFLEILSEGGFSRKAYYKILASIFKPGGRLRETHVNQSLVLLYRSYALDNYKHFLSKRNKRQTKKLGKALRKFNLDGLNNLNSIVAEILTDVELEKIRHKALGFLNYELQTIRSLRPFIASDNDLHQIRFHTKALGYITKFINELSPAQQLNDLLRMAKPTEKLIGNWHDRVVLRNSLDSYLQKHPGAPDTEEARKLIRQINNRNKASLKTIADRLDGFINIVL